MAVTQYDILLMVAAVAESRPIMVVEKSAATRFRRSFKAWRGLVGLAPKAYFC
jgi:hypothetical protein